MVLADEVVRMLVAQDPGRSADNALGLLIKHLGADGAACFRVDGERVALFAGRRVDQSALDCVALTWDDARHSLSEGETFDADRRFALVPIGEPGAITGLLYVAASHGLVLDHETLGHFLPLLRAALDAIPYAGPPAVEAYIERTPAAEFQREQLLLLLERSEWNIARVARVKGVARLTIYEQMKRWGIERRKISKGARVRTGVRGAGA